MSNLPLGVGVLMIPGNRPEDEWAEKVFLALGDVIQAYCDKTPGLVPEDLSYALRDIADQVDADPEYFRYQPHPLDDEREVAADKEA